MGGCSLYIYNITRLFRVFNRKFSGVYETGRSKDCFGENYFFYIGFTKTDQEIIEETQKCIKTGRKQKEPRYDEDKIY